MAYGARNRNHFPLFCLSTPDKRTKGFFTFPPRLDLICFLIYFILFVGKECKEKLNKVSEERGQGWISKKESQERREGCKIRERGGKLLFCLLRMSVTGAKCACVPSKIEFAFIHFWLMQPHKKKPFGLNPPTPLEILFTYSFILYAVFSFKNYQLVFEHSPTLPLWNGQWPSLRWAWISPWVAH